MIQFITRGHKNMQNKEVKYYPQIAPTQPMALNEVIAQIERECTVSGPDVLAVLNALQHVIIQGLRNGHAIRLGDLGSFRPTLHSEGESDPKLVTAHLIKRVRCRFTPSATINRMLATANVQFQIFRTPSEGAVVPGV